MDGPADPGRRLKGQRNDARGCGRWGAKFGCGVLLLSLVMLAVANFIGAPLWAVTLAAAAVLVAGNL